MPNSHGVRVLLDAGTLWCAREEGEAGFRALPTTFYAMVKELGALLLVWCCPVRRLSAESTVSAVTPFIYLEPADHWCVALRRGCGQTAVALPVCRFLILM